MLKATALSDICLRTVAAMLFLLTLAGAVAAQDPVRIANDQPLHPPRTIALEEMWRVGGDDGEYLFGMIIDTMADAEGNVYLLDYQMGQVEVFAPDGGHLRTLSRQGDGPGEVRVPVAMTMMGDDTLGLVEIFPAKIKKLTLDGEPAGTLTLTSEEGAQTGFNFAIGCRYRSGVLMLAGMRGSPVEGGQKRSHYVARFADTGVEMVRFRTADTVLQFNPPLFREDELLPPFWFGNALGPDGKTYIASSRDEYEIEVYAPDGSLERVFTREFENRPRDSRDFSRMKAMVKAWYTNFPMEVPCEFADHDPTISEIFVDADGIVWVQHNRSRHDLPDGVMLTYDTFDAEGRYLREVSVACSGDPAYDGLRFLDDGRVLLIKGYVLARWASISPGGHADFGEDEAEEMAAVYCRIVEQ